MSDFWARRRKAVQAEEEAEARQKVAAKEAEARAELEEKTDAEILRDLELPEPDEMKAGDDFSAFLKTTVPERIRVRALRRLWTTNPVLANLDGLIEYGEDFTDASTVVENLQTAYRVGEGMLKHIEKLAEAAAAAEESETETGESESETGESVTDASENLTPTDKSDNFTRAETSPDEVNPDKLSRVNIAQSNEESEEKPQYFANDEEKPSKLRRMRYSFDREP